MLDPAPLHAASRRPIPRQGPKGDIPTAMARGLGLRERRTKRPRTRERRGRAARRGARVAATPQAPEAPLSWRLEPSLAQARPWARERPCRGVPACGRGVVPCAPGVPGAWTRPGCAGRHSGCPRPPATDRGPASSGCRTDRGSVRLRDQRARVELAAVQLRLEQVMALMPAAHGVAQTALAVLGRLDQRLLLVVQFQLFELLLDTGPRPGK